MPKAGAPCGSKSPLEPRLIEASKTGLTPGSVRVNLHRGMRMLRERLGQEVK